MAPVLSQMNPIQYFLITNIKLSYYCYVHTVHID